MLNFLFPRYRIALQFEFPSSLRTIICHPQAYYWYFTEYVIWSVIFYASLDDCDQAVRRSRDLTNGNNNIVLRPADCCQWHPISTNIGKHSTLCCLLVHVLLCHCVTPATVVGNVFTLTCASNYTYVSVQRDSHGLVRGRETRVRSGWLRTPAQPGLHPNEDICQRSIVEFF